MQRFVSSVVNLSFDTNLISNFKELDSMKGLQLRELYLANNPVRQNISDEKYQSEVTHRFPSLQYLDGQKIERKVEAPVRSLYFTLLMLIGWIASDSGKFIRFC
jgi:hypothetical protein